MNDKIKRLEQENAELRAHCDELKKLAGFLKIHFDVNDIDLPRVFEKYNEVMNKTPIQSLADIQANAIDNAYDIAKEWIEQGEGVSDLEMTPHNISMMLAGLGQICITANQLREQVK